MSGSITVSVIKSAYHLSTACLKVVLLPAGCMLEEFRGWTNVALSNLNFVLCFHNKHSDDSWELSLIGNCNCKYHLTYEKS